MLLASTVIGKDDCVRYTHIIYCKKSATLYRLMNDTWIWKYPSALLEKYMGEHKREKYI